MIRVKADTLKKFLENVFLKAGLPRKDAVAVTDHLIFCNLRGIDSHGVIRTSGYLKRLAEGGTNAIPKIKAVKRKPSAVLLDGDNGMGQVVGLYASDLAVRKAKKTGMCLVGVKGSSHYGAASYYTMRIAKANMIGLSSTNVNPIIAPWGGSSRGIGNNPLSIAVPGPQEKPIVFDIAMSIVAGGKIKLAKGEKNIPLGWVLDKDGKDSQDPGAFYKGGSLMPFGKYKGYALAFMLEILAGVLVGASIMDEIPVWHRDTNVPVNIGHFFIAIDVERFMGEDIFKNRLIGMVDELRGRSSGEGICTVFMPGEVEEGIEKERRENGIPFTDEIWDELLEISSSFGEPIKLSEADL